MIKEYFKIAYENLLNRRLRTWLTMIGIFIGIAAIVSLISLGQGLSNAISKEFEVLGTDKLIILPEGSLGAPGTPGAVILTEKDLDIVQKVPGISMAGGFLTSTVKLEFKDEIAYVYLSGFPLTREKKLIDEVSGIKIVEGRDLRTGDKNKAVIGYDLHYTTTVFKKQIDIGDKIIVNEKSFEVVGVNRKIGSTADDTAVIIPLDPARELLNKPDELTMIITKSAKGIDPVDLSDLVKKKLRQSRNVKIGEEDFSVQTGEQLLSSFNVILNIVQVVLIGIASISLVVGGVGITNSMYTSVLQRTREIGIMKAVGAKNSDIVTLFLIEAGLLGLTGGLIGILIGISFSKLVEYGATVYLNQPLLQASFPWYLILGTMLFSFIVGTIAGTFPAIQASKLKPVDALRYE